MSLTAALEAMLLMATDPVPTDELAAALSAPSAEVEAELEAIAGFYDEHERGLRLRRIAGGWRFATDPSVADVIEGWLVSDQRARLTQAALETLAVVAYLQPVSRGRIAAVRGVNVDGVVKTLLVRGLIQEAGEDPVTGAMTFGTTALFLQKLGLNSLRELPDLAPLLPDAVALEAELGQLAAESTAAAAEAQPKENDD
ncbi:SMC-Scp complex subunit ScpB [Tessaracoccus flavus]|uniref:SMC-Scp complex subunit ScpB n=1 Tax=Tessaracoccus flavus TaxID=1610493 RepID=A0A1Q2CF75_9ACTN|nr:SMC-Scp complex subunit ScpB [Tessaracoccus flavus]AQP44761.1 SMC-Scp complex subunit ScpB [Tessaracoccus flavus]SDZ16927.1 segregation and condensation protein B [Tessaracoccus flavus]